MIRTQRCINLPFLADIAFVETVIGELSNVALKHRRAFAAWMMFKKLNWKMAVAIKPSRAGFRSAVRDCVDDPCTQRRYFPIIVAVVIIFVIRRRAGKARRCAESVLSLTHRHNLFAQSLCMHAITGWPNRI
ncbi:MAG TPA: hypothetical protein VGO49_09535 [Bradyrhizobium sp.]|nr:hypothetical protein [Bradyrhizobium sp.]